MMFIQHPLQFGCKLYKQVDQYSLERNNPAIIYNHRSIYVHPKPLIVIYTPLVPRPDRQGFLRLQLAQDIWSNDTYRCPDDAKTSKHQRERRE
jgi:hypothetical protein